MEWGGIAGARGGQGRECQSDGVGEDSGGARGTGKGERQLDGVCRMMTDYRPDGIGSGQGAG